MKPDQDLTEPSCAQFQALSVIENPPFPAGLGERMKGLEPSTFFSLMAQAKRYLVKKMGSIQGRVYR
jgi:hypothetical protein